MKWCIFSCLPWVALLVLHFGLHVSALKCYQCTYWPGKNGHDENCSDGPFSGNKVITCGERASASSLAGNSHSYERANDKWMCAKGEEIIDGSYVVQRGCQIMKSDFKTKCGLRYFWNFPYFGYNNQTMNTCFCSGDKCNSASGLKGSLTLGGIVVATLFTSKYVF